MAGLDSFGAGKDVAVGLKSSWNLEILMSEQEKRKNQRHMRIHKLYTWKERIPQRGLGSNAAAGI